MFNWIPNHLLKFTLSLLEASDIFPLDVWYLEKRGVKAHSLENLCDISKAATLE
jgi:hypothetical protein